MFTGYTYAGMALELYGSFEEARLKMEPSTWPEGMEINFNANDEVWLFLRDLRMTDAFVICGQWAAAVEQAQTQTKQAQADPVDWKKKADWVNEKVNLDKQHYGTNAAVLRKDVICAHYALLEKMTNKLFYTTIPKKRMAAQQNYFIQRMLPSVKGVAPPFNLFCKQF